MRGGTWDSERNAGPFRGAGKRRGEKMRETSQDAEGKQTKNKKRKNYGAERS
jgi:hypothetical protein